MVLALGCDPNSGLFVSTSQVMAKLVYTYCTCKYTNYRVCPCMHHMLLYMNKYCSLCHNGIISGLLVTLL